MKHLPAQHLKPRYYEPIEDQLQDLFLAVIFRPLIGVISDATDQMSQSAHGFMNAAENPLQMALRSGKVQYEAGTFTGQFNAAISRVLQAIGAKWDRKSKVYRIEPVLTTGWVKAEAAIYNQTARDVHKALKAKLDQIEKDLKANIDKRPIRAQPTLHQIQKDFVSVAKAIEIKPELSEDATARMAKAYTENIKPYIEDFSRGMIADLRTAIEKNATEGYRFDKLIDGIKRKYGVTTNKAKFLARQETGLFMAQYRQQRFSEAGVTHYKWSTSHDERVRPAPGTHGIARANNHRVLDGRTFAYANPPVVDTATGRKANPGQDFNCRCVDMPILGKTAILA